MNDKYLRNCFEILFKYKFERIYDFVDKLEHILLDSDLGLFEYPEEMEEANIWIEAQKSENKICYLVGDDPDNILLFAMPLEYEIFYDIYLENFNLNSVLKVEFLE